MATTADPPAPTVEIPDPESVRRRLAFVLTEAGVLRAQLRASVKYQRELERLKRIGVTPTGGATAEVVT